MRAPRLLLRWSALGLLGTGIAAGAWLLAIQVLLVLFSPLGQWQVPRISKVTVVRLDKDPEKNFTDRLIVKHGEREREFEMLKEEQAGLRPDDQLWVLENYYATSLRPAQFRLTPLRLALEYPLPWMLLAGWILLRILRSRWGLPPEPELNPAVPRKVLTDDYHQRAQRFSAPPPEAKA